VKQRKHYSPEQKVIILRELLENNVPISQLAEKYEVHTNDIYNWKKKLFESAAEIFGSKSAGPPHDAFNLGRRIDLLKTSNQTALPSFLAEEDKWVTIKVSSEAIRTINKNGLFSVVKQLRAAGEKI